MLASPEGSAPPQFLSVKCDQSTYEIRGHASLLLRWCRHCTPTALLQVPVASAHAGVSQTRREGAQVPCLLPFPAVLLQQGWAPWAPLLSSTQGSVFDSRSSCFCSGDSQQTLGWRPSWRVPANPSAHQAAPTFPLPWAVQAASLSHARPVSLSLPGH